MDYSWRLGLLGNSSTASWISYPRGWQARATDKVLRLCSFFLCPLYFFPFFVFTSYFLLLCLCLISFFLLYSKVFGRTPIHEFISFSHTWMVLTFFTRQNGPCFARSFACQKLNYNNEWHNYFYHIALYIKLSKIILNFFQKIYPSDFPEFLKLHGWFGMRRLILF